MVGWMDGWMEAADDDDEMVLSKYVAYECADRESSVECGRTAAKVVEGINEERIELMSAHALLGWRAGWVFRKTFRLNEGSLSWSSCASIRILVMVCSCSIKTDGVLPTGRSVSRSVKTILFRLERLVLSQSAGARKDARKFSAQRPI